MPCPARNKAWLTAVAAKALEMAKVLASADVPKAVRAMRDAACAACPHSTLARGHTWCECCSCPKWNLGPVNSSTGFKNKKAEWMCPRPEPAFGVWEAPNDGR